MSVSIVTSSTLTQKQLHANPWNIIFREISVAGRDGYIFDSLPDEDPGRDETASIELWTKDGDLVTIGTGRSAFSKEKPPMDDMVIQASEILVPGIPR
ncbi:hypothetical protein [Rhodococcus sp. NPDC058521]|uniref:hypothetical protein n=1 Tax=Rhodococcus sp. NPDC058521 TaxID=3346536 RepID=UPI00364DCF40